MKYIQLSILVLGILTVSAQTNQTYNNQSSNYSTTQPYPQQGYDNQSDTINSTNYQTNNPYNYSNILNDTRPRIQESKIHLKLRKQLNLNQKYNHTQNVTYYNPQEQQYETIVIFNETKTKNRQTPNEYYFYQNTTLVTLNKEYNAFGNVVYRSIDYDFYLVIEGNSTSQSLQNTNYQLHGTIVLENHTLNGNHSGQGYTQYNKNGGWGQVSSSSYGDSSFANGQGQIENNKYSSNYETSGQYKYKNFNNLPINYNSQTSDFTQGQDSSSFQGNIDINEQLSYSSNKTKNSQQSNQQSNSKNLNSDKYSVSNYQSKNKDNWTNTQKSHNTQNNQTQSDYLINHEDISSRDSGMSIHSDNQTISKSQGNGRSINYNNSAYKPSYDNSLNFNKNVDASYYNINSTVYDKGLDEKIVSEIQNTNITNYQYSQIEKDGNYSANGYGNLDVARNLTNTVVNTVNGTTTTNVNVHGKDEYITADYYSGVPDIYTSENDIQMSYTNTQHQPQQLTSLRGARKSTGSWKQVEVEELLSSNSLIPEEAIQAVNQKYNPEQEGYQFDQILNVHEQIVSGFNYQIKLQYNNQDGDTRIYQVIIYSIPWTNQPDQIISCQRLGN